MQLIFLQRHTGKHMDKRKQIIEIVSYDLTWPDQFASEAEKLQQIFGDNVVAIHHIGSTSIPGMPAKPTIDIVLSVKSIDLVDQHNDAMADLGYEAWGEYRIPGRRFFVKGDDKRTHHVHTFQVGSHDVTRHLNFRDYLIAHPDEAKAYADLKIKLAEAFRHNRRGYVTHKQDFVKALEAKALCWAQESHKS